MNLIKCDKGHYYDLDKYKACPFCSRNNESECEYCIECVFGDNLGTKYKLHKGINRIGTGYLMDVCVVDDIQITRDNHCSIVYDNDVCTLIPTAGSLTYINSVLMEKASVLTTNDVFRIGRSDFILKRTNGD